MKEVDTFLILQSKGIIEILLLLFENENGLRKVDIRAKAKINPKTFARAFTILERDHFLKVIKYRNATIFNLTNESRKIVQILFKAQKSFDKFILDNSNSNTYEIEHKYEETLRLE